MDEHHDKADVDQKRPPKHRMCAVQSTEPYWRMAVHMQYPLAQVPGASSGSERAPAEEEEQPREDRQEQDQGTLTDQQKEAECQAECERCG